MEYPFLSSLDFSMAELVVAISAIFFFVAGTLFQLTAMMRCPRYARRARKGKIWFSAARPPVSVILYTEDDIEALDFSLPAILEQDYDRFEVIVVNDGASENVRDYIKKLAGKHDNLYCTFVPVGAHSLSRKKLAVTIGMKAARYDIVAVTEAGCRPASDKWLGSMMRNFTTDIEIVIGNTKEVSDVKPKWYLGFYRLAFKMKFLGRAAINRPYMGEGSNMFFFKEMFFKAKGFSEHLDIIYGDDDVFINRLMTRKNTRAEFSPEALVECRCEDAGTAIAEMRLRRDFTGKLLKGAFSPTMFFGKAVSWGFYISVVAAVACGTAFSNTALAVCPPGLLVLWWLTEWAVYCSNAKVLSSPVRPAAATLYDIVSPAIDWRFRYMGRRTMAKNYTWRIKN